MKYVFIVALLFVATMVNAQPAILKNKTGKLDTLVINYLLKYEMATSKGDFFYTDVEKLTFFEKDERFQDTYNFYQNKGITVDFTAAAIPHDIMSPVQLTKPITDADLIVFHLSRFNKTRLAGKGLQAAGLLLSTVSAVAVVNWKDTETVRSLAVVGGLASVVGFIVDFTASQHLTNLQKEFQVRKK